MYGIHIAQFIYIYRSLGIWGAIFERISRRFGKKFTAIAWHFPMRLKDGTKLYMRLGQSDLAIATCIFAGDEYTWLHDLNDEFNTIIDCGANIGCAAIKLLQFFPKAFVVAVEPDEQNYRLCQRNLQSYSDRTKLFKNGIWSKNVGLKVVR